MGEIKKKTSPTTQSEQRVANSYDCYGLRITLANGNTCRERGGNRARGKSLAGPKITTTTTQRGSNNNKSSSSEKQRQAAAAAAEAEGQRSGREKRWRREALGLVCNRSQRFSPRCFPSCKAPSRRRASPSACPPTRRRWRRRGS